MTDEMIEQIKKDREAGTPGPWAVDFSYQWPSKVRAAPPFNERWICDACVQPSPNDQSHTLANARRIARVPDMEARILADAEKLKAAEELAGLDCADVIEKALGEGAIGDKWAWIFEDTLTELKSALNAFHRAKHRQAAILRSYEVPANEARMDALWDVAQNDPDPNGDVTVGKRKLRTDGGEER